MFTPMRTPRTRAEFERAFHFALEHKTILPMGAEEYIYSLRSVRMLPNGRLDFLSVDERARLHANMSLNVMTGPLREGLGNEMDQPTSKGGDQIAFTNDDLTQLGKQKASKKKAAPKAVAKKTLSKKGAKKKTKKKSVRSSSIKKRKRK